MRIWLSLCFALLLSALWSVSAVAQESISNFDVVMDIEPSGDTVITETITYDFGPNRRRGIFRELPRYGDYAGVKRDYKYELISVTRDGQPETVSTSREGNAVNWRVGRADVYLEPGEYIYQFKYRVPDPVYRQDGADEIYWNMTGNFWSVPIQSARAQINFPAGASITDVSAYTGRQGARQQDAGGSTANVQFTGNRVIVQTTAPLPARSGLTVSASIKQGIIAPMSEAQKRELGWIRWGAMILLGAGGTALFGFYYSLWNRVGRDPAKPPVFARYAPPKGYSAAAVHYIHNKRHKGQDALSALVMQLGSEGVLHVKADKKITTLTRLKPPTSEDGKLLMDTLFSGRDALVMDGKTDKTLYKGAMKFLTEISKRYGRDYYRRNLGWAMLGIIGSALLTIIVMVSPVSKNGPVIVGLFLAIAAMNLLFLKLLPAPTKYGAQVMSEIEGFKLYLELAEKDRINTANPLGERAPMMSTELYERFMPYAMALGVEKPWTKQFETTLPREAKDYKPSYASGRQIDRIGSGRAPVDFGKTIAKAMTAGVAAAAPVSQSSGSGFSSGSGGGGFSGGGGGGGGGGSW